MNCSSVPSPLRDRLKRWRKAHIDTMSCLKGLTKLQIGVAIAIGLDVVVTIMLFLYGVLADPLFIQQDVKNYSFYTSLLDIVIYAIVRALSVGAAYVILKLVAWCSTIILIGKEALFFIEHRLDNVVITPLHYILAGYCTIMGWAVLGLAKITRDTDDTDVTTLPPTGLRFKMYDEESVDLLREPSLIKRTGSPSERSGLLGINSDSSIVEVQPSPGGYNSFLHISDDGGVINQRLKRGLGGLGTVDDEIGVVGSLNSSSADVQAPSGKTQVAIMPSIPRLVGLMLHPQDGVHLQDRKRLFSSYANCFVGKEAVDWLVQMVKSADRSQAVAILQTVMEKGYFSPSTNTKRFKDSEDDFYTFSDMKNLPISYLDSIDSKPPARDSSLSVSPGSAAIFEWPAEIDHLVREMRDERDGVPIRDRRLTNAYTKTTQMHPRCFLGGEAVEWLVGRTRRLPRAEDARHAMNVLLSGNIMYDISTLDTGLPFSEKRFYRFREDANDQPAGASQQHLDFSEVVSLVSKLNAHHPRAPTPPPTSASPAGVFGNGSAPIAGAESDDFSPRPVSVPKPIFRDSHRLSAPASDGIVSKTPSPSLRNFVEEMKQEGSGVPLKPRKNKLTKEKVMSFTGREGVDWMCRTKKLTEREHGARILQRLLRAGVIGWVPRSQPPQRGPGDDLPYFDSDKEVYFFPEEIKSTTPSQTPTRPSQIITDSPSSFPSGFAPSSPSSGSSSPASLSRNNSKRGLGPLLSNFVTEMKDPKLGIEMKDHSMMISNTESVTYHNCFVGSAAVDWISSKMGLVDRGHGAKILQKLVDGGVILSVIPQGTTQVTFLDDGYHLYRFSNDM